MKTTVARTTVARTTALAAAALLALAGCSHATPSASESVTPEPSATPSETPSATPAADAGNYGTFAPFAADGIIGVALPNSSARWAKIGEQFNADLGATGLTPDVQYAGDATSVQGSQIGAMVAEGAKVIIVAAINPNSLSSDLEAAKAAGVTIISFDRLVSDTTAVDFYVAYNMHIVGELQAKALIRGLQERVPGKSKYTIEIFSGSPDDPSAGWFYDGAMRILQPKIDDGTLVVGSGETSQTKTSTANWDPANSRSRMDSLITRYYKNTALDGVLGPNDGVAQAIIQSCQAAGLPVPVVTGQDSQPDAVASIMRGEQYMTLDKAGQWLVEHSVAMTQDLQKGKTPAVNDGTTYNNGAKLVPSFLVVPVTVTKANAAEVYKDNPDLYPLTQQ